MKRLVELLFILVSILFVTGYLTSTDKKNLDKILVQLVPTKEIVLSSTPTIPISPTIILSPTPQILGKETQENEGILVTRVVDGDTIELENGKTLRYIGINTPETVDPRRLRQCFGKEASDFNKQLVLGKRVKLEKDISEMDRYGRLLRYVYIEDSSGQTIFVNEYLVREGYAQSSSYPPDVKYQEIFRNAEAVAREEKKGLWEFCK